MSKIFSSCTVDVLQIFSRTLCFFQNVGVIKAYNFSHTNVNFSLNFEKFLQGFISLLEELKLVLDRLYIERNKSLVKSHEYSNHGIENELRSSSENFSELQSHPANVQNNYTKLPQHSSNTMSQKYSELQNATDRQNFSDLQNTTSNPQSFMEMRNSATGLLCDNDNPLINSSGQIHNHLLTNHNALKEITFNNTNLIVNSSSSLVTHQTITTNLIPNDSTIVTHQNSCNLPTENTGMMVTHQDVGTSLISNNSSSLVTHQTNFGISDTSNKISDNQYIDHQGLTPGSQLLAIESLVQGNSPQEDEDDALNTEEITFRSLDIVNQDNLNVNAGGSNCDDLIDHWSKSKEQDDSNLKENETSKNQTSNKKCYTCDICHKTLSSHWNLVYHSATHSGVKPFCCEHCGKLFTTSSNLNAHLTRQHNLNTESAYACPECGKLFVRKTALDIHLAGHRGIKPFSCHICSKKFTQKVTRDIHILTHTREYPFQCDVCSKRFTTKSKLNFHQKKHGDLQYTCSLCEKQFSTRQYLNDHYKTHNVTHTEATPCCLDTVSESSRTQIIPISRLSCPLCDQTFKSQGSLTRHTKAKHNPLAPWFYCKVPDCNRTIKTFATRCQLNKHNKRHHSIKQRKFTCSSCCKEFTEKSSLIYHERQNHTTGLSPRQLKPHACHTCSKRFPTKSKLNIHMRIHTQEPQFTCNVCSKSFYYKSSLLKHRLMHSALPTDKLPSCNKCGKVFKSKNTLSYHLKSHEGNYQFTCSTCGRQFVRKCHYEEHLRSHTTERPFKCNNCGHGFKTKKHLREHVKKQHTSNEVGLTMQSLFDSITNEDALATPQHNFNVMLQYPSH